MSAHQPHMKPVCALTVSFGEVQIPGIPEATVEGIWLKAAALISKSDAIVSAPGGTNSWLVESTTGNRPHFVTKEKSGRFKCGDGCKMRLSTRMCAHSVAVADPLNLLPSSLDWRKKCKGASVSLAGMILSDTPKGAGKKGRKPAKKYGQSAAGRITVTNYANPFDEQLIPSPSSPFEQSEFFPKWVSRRITVCQEGYIPLHMTCASLEEKGGLTGAHPMARKTLVKRVLVITISRNPVLDPPYQGERIYAYHQKSV